MISFAFSSTDFGTLIRKALAEFKLMNKSNRIDCSIGRSQNFRP